MINLQELMFFKAMTHKVDTETTPGDMTKEVFDPTSEVETAGGIPNFVKSYGGIAFAIPLTDNNDGTYSTTVTYEQIKAAYDLHRDIVAIVDSTAILKLVIAEISADGNSAGFTFGYTQVMMNGTMIFTRAIHYLHMNGEDSWEDTDVETDLSFYQTKPIWEEITSLTLSSNTSFIELDLPDGYDEFLFEVYTPMPGESSNAIVYPYNSYSNNGTPTDITLSQWVYQTGASAHWLTIKLKTIVLGGEKHFQIESVSRISGNNNNHNPQQSGEVLKSQYFSTDDGKQLLQWARIRYERTCVAGTVYKLFGKK